MRDSYVPLFKDTLTSSIWACDLEVRVAWFFLLLQADEDGFVSGTAPGLAQQAHISVEGMRRALALFEAPDPDSRTPDHDGRRLERVARGWRVLNLVAARERARREAERSRKRRWAQEHRAGDHGPPEEEAPSNEQAKEEALDGCDPVDREPPPVDAPSTPRSAPVDARKRKRTRTTPPPPPPQISNQRAEEEGLRFYDLDGFEPSDGLVAWFERCGLPPMALNARLRKVRNANVRIGGKHGVGDREEWCRLQLPRWKKWWLDDGGGAEPLPVTRRPSSPAERPSSPLPVVGTGVPMPVELQRFVATGVLPPKTAPPAAEVAA